MHPYDYPYLHGSIHLWMHARIRPTIRAQISETISFLQVVRLNFSVHFLSLLFVLHVPSISCFMMWSPLWSSVKGTNYEASCDAVASVLLLSRVVPCVHTYSLAPCAAAKHRSRHSRVRTAAMSMRTCSCVKVSRRHVCTRKQHVNNDALLILVLRKSLSAACSGRFASVEGGWVGLRRGDIRNYIGGFIIKSCWTSS
jgi:hypothetical protein